MNAPALLAFAAGPADPRSARTAREIALSTRRLRPDLTVDVAVASGRPSLDTAVTRLAAAGHREVVVVPLLIAPTDQLELELITAVDAAARSDPAVHVRAAGCVGPEPSLLSVLDERLRSCLREARVRELDAIVLASAGSSDARMQVAVARLARLWSARHHLPTSIAFAETSPPSTGEAVREWRRRGKRHVAVGSLFITAGPRADRAAELALEAGACAVSAPLGAHEELSRVLVARYSVGALELMPV
jgi:sirohydrochlorin ferrochelatase